MTADDLRLIEKGKPARIGFHKKVEIDRVFLDSIREADLMQRDFLPYADDLLILHGTKDEIVPIETVRAFAENNVIEFIPIENADHRFQSPEKMDRVIAEVFAFFGMK
jgi:pimeloyl-ACP methyl ester carboxylesterase